MIRAMTEIDWPAVSRIYGEGIATGNATFETDVPDWFRWDASHHQSCRLVVDEDGEVLAWAALSPVSRRPMYRGRARGQHLRRPGGEGTEDVAG